MSSLDLAAIRQALAAALREIPGLFVYEQWPGTPSVFPCAVIFPPDRVDYSKTSRRSLDMATWSLMLLVGPMSPTSQEFLEGLMSGTGDLSVIEALIVDRSLGGTISNLRVPEMATGLYRVSTGTNESVLGCEVTIEVMA